jgi:hypothetical protein
MIDFRQMIPALKAIQERQMTETLDIIRHGTTVATAVPCRLHSGRLFSEPGDPQDANMRATSEFGITVPLGTDVEIGDTIVARGGALRLIAGEVMKHDTWATAIRIWATRPKNTTPMTSVTLWRYNAAIDDWEIAGTWDVQVVYDRNQPQEPPVRFSPAASARLKGGWLIGDLTFAPKVGDRFTLEGYACVIREVYPLQPQHIEAKFSMDISGE